MRIIHLAIRTKPVVFVSTREIISHLIINRVSLPLNSRIHQIAFWRNDRVYSHHTTSSSRSKLTLQRHSVLLFWIANHRLCLGIQATREKIVSLLQQMISESSSRTLDYRIRTDRTRIRFIWKLMTQEEVAATTRTSFTLSQTSLQ